MSPLARWLKFNLVGGIGILVQLSALVVFNRVAPGHYLVATAAAVELTLLHNFIWHLNLTWRDRRDGSTLLARLIRFHLSNGLISLFGNLVLTRIFKQEMHLSLLVSNAISIACCSLLNFVMGDRWAFAQQAGAGQI
jgi:putative flippase GtrA